MCKVVAQGFKVKQTSNEVALWKNTEAAMLLSIIKIAHLQSCNEFSIMQTFHNPYQQLFPQVAMELSLKKKKRKTSWLDFYKTIKKVFP